MRAAVLPVCLAGCLAAPPPPAADDPVDAGGGAADARVLACVPGSQLDLAHVSRVSVVHDASVQLSLPGLAVFVNPGLDTLVIPELSVAVAAGDPRVSTTAVLGGAEAGLVLAPGEAKGVLSQWASAVVRPAFEERWVDTARPDLTAGFALFGEELDDAPSSIDVALQVVAGEYEFAPTISLVEDDSKMSGTPLAATRMSAFCD